MNYKIEVIKTSRYCYINAISDTNERIGKVCIDLDSEDATRYINDNPNIAKIILVSTVPTACGHGVATSMLNKAIEIFNDYVLYLNVVPLPRNDRDKDKKGLVNFYSKFGFIKYDKDICVTTMIKK